MLECPKERVFVRRFFSTLKSTYDQLIIGLNYISVAVIFLMAFLVFSDVVGRYFFNHPIPGTTELVKCAIIVIIFLGITYTMQQDRHIRTTVIMDRLPPGIKLWCEVLACVIGVVIFVSMCHFSLQAAWDSWIVREFDGVQVKVPVYPSRFALVLGSGLLVVQYILHLVNHLSGLIRYYKGKGS